MKRPKKMYSRGKGARTRTRKAREKILSGVSGRGGGSKVPGSDKVCGNVSGPHGQKAVLDEGLRTTIRWTLCLRHRV